MDGLSREKRIGQIFFNNLCQNIVCVVFLFGIGVDESQAGLGFQDSSLMYVFPTATFT
uniref:Uncharacterized protein n=1 Tax=Romanomermis culicivorax TaxID=13658 RepID=A0A915J996_ROMCU